MYLCGLCVELHVYILSCFMTLICGEDGTQQEARCCYADVSKLEGMAAYFFDTVYVSICMNLLLLGGPAVHMGCGSCMPSYKDWGHLCKLSYKELGVDFYCMLPHKLSWGQISALMCGEAY